MVGAGTGGVSAAGGGELEEINGLLVLVLLRLLHGRLLHGRLLRWMWQCSSGGGGGERGQGDSGGSGE